MKFYSILLVSFLSSLTVIVHAESYKEGEHYTLIEGAAAETGNKIKVEEVFWYGCNHCFSLETPVKKWLTGVDKNKVDFVAVPATLGNMWDWHAHYYYASKFLGILDTVHTPMFDAIHLQNAKGVNCSSFDDCAETFAKFVAGLQDKISAEKFEAMYRSFGVLNKINQSKQLMKKYKVTGVPAFVVAGKYLTSVQNAGSAANLFELINFLVSKELAARGKK